jgi:hypothetical protein
MQLYLLLTLLVGGAIAVCVIGWLLKSAQLEHLDGVIAAAQTRLLQLQAIAAEVAKFEAQKQLLQRKLDTIRDLKALQTASVRLIDEVSRSVPEFVWLERMDQTGNGLNFVGKSNSLNAVANLIQNLQERTHPPAPDGQPRVCQPSQRAGCWFPQVDLSQSTEAENVVSFTVTASFQPPPPEAPPEDAAAAAPAPAAGGQP